MSSFIGMSGPDRDSSVWVTQSSFATTNNLVTPAGTGIELVTTRQGIINEYEKAATSGVSPKLFFKFINSKMKDIELAKLEDNLKKLQVVVGLSKDLGQQALFERLSEMLAITVREMEVSAVGITKFVMRQDIEKFRKVRKEGGFTNVYFERWEKYPHVPPAEVVKDLKRIREMALFDDYWVLYTDYSKEHKELKTNKDKIREKDPILFGVFSYQPDKFYVIKDWIDEHCDLTLDEFVTTLQKDDPAYSALPVEFTIQSFEQVKKEVLERYERLKGTNSSNFRSNMVVEDTINATKKPKRSWFKRWFGGSDGVGMG